MLPIYDDMPLPDPQKDTRKKYPYDQLEINQYFFAPRLGSNTPLASIGNKRYAPKRFAQRFIVRDGVPGLGVWRVE